jgi:hypothetical protein
LALAPRRAWSGALPSRRRGETIRGALAVLVSFAALGTVAAASLTTASSAEPRQQAQAAQLDDGAAVGRSHWDWIRGWTRAD